MSHGINFIDGREWVFARCDCGWESAPMLGFEDAADAYGDHRATQAINDFALDGPSEQGSGS